MKKRQKSLAEIDAKILRLLPHLAKIMLLPHMTLEDVLPRALLYQLRSDAEKSDFSPSQMFFSEPEAAEYLRTDLKTVTYAATRSKELAYILIGRERCYRRADLDKFAEKRRKASVWG